MKTVVKPGPVIVITDCSGTEVVTGPVGEVPGVDSVPGLVFGPVGEVPGVDSVPGLVFGPVGGT